MTSLFLPHPAYAEEQEHARTILTFHVLRSGFVAGATVSLMTATSSLLFSRIRHQTPLSLSSFGRTSLIHAARGGPIGLALIGIVLVPYMHGREEIEWQDRSWRLLENRGQVECDWWLLGGSAVGAAAAPFVLRRNAGAVAGKAIQGGVKSIGTATAVSGGASLGSVTGMLAYLARPGSPSRGGQEIVDASRDVAKEGIEVAKGK
ncbi:hypothetical protein NA57DRAFT_74538 [Rhizodiscina lignyota]|uniref:Uncharacterized protein n=1 Tax=Rhizodiscina lignyota TaxID=1504668 RepID=A0A9P4IFR9_9PEZI|nr:hypothetical protein NA57DRAFT_74538 [Rhizodiscina lignyota]